MQCTSCDVDACMVLWFFQISSNDCFSFTRENFTSHNRWEKAAAWFERQNWFLRLCPFPIYGTRWDKRSLFERGRNKSGSSWPFLKPKVSYSSMKCSEFFIAYHHNPVDLLNVERSKNPAIPKKKPVIPKFGVGTVLFCFNYQCNPKELRKRKKVRSHRDISRYTGPIVSEIENKMVWYAFRIRWDLDIKDS